MAFGAGTAFPKYECGVQPVCPQLGHGGPGAPCRQKGVGLGTLPNRRLCPQLPAATVQGFWMADPQAVGLPIRLGYRYISILLTLSLTYVHVSLASKAETELKRLLLFIAQETASISSLLPLLLVI